MIVRRGYRQPPSFHMERLRTVPLGHYYDVMTNGFGRHARLSGADHAAGSLGRIAAYVRALQLGRTRPRRRAFGGRTTKLSQPAAAAAPGEHEKR